MSTNVDVNKFVQNLKSRIADLEYELVLRNTLVEQLEEELEFYKENQKSEKTSLADVKEAKPVGTGV